MLELENPSVLNKPSGSRLKFDRFSIRANVAQAVAFVLCLMFGLALIANTHGAGDGIWYWYSVFFLSGEKHLYADLHLALQPLFVLETGAFIAVLGKGWLALKLTAVLHMAAYCLAFLLLVRQTKFSDLHKAMLLACSFVISISFEAYRFDDYHVLTDCFVLYSLVALLSLRTSPNISRTLALAATLGGLSGLAVTTRLNDGAALFVGVFLAIVCLGPAKKALSLLLFCITTGLTTIVVVLLTGDSLRDYAQYSVFGAAGSKGGAGGVLTQPLRLPWSTVLWLVHSAPRGTLLDASALVVICVLLASQFRQGRHWLVLGLAIFGAVLVTFQAQRREVFQNNALLMDLTGLLVLMAFGLGILVAGRFVLSLVNPKRTDEWDRRQILLLIPIGQIASGSMSTGGTHLGLYGPVGAIIVLLAICFPILGGARWRRDSVIALAILLTFCTINYRFNNPYSWHTYSEKPILASRTWYQHPEYGPMIIDRDLLQMIKPVCDATRGSGSDNELLSIPYPYANYFCAKTPWHGYVQTFFDTASQQTVQNLIDELRTPPKWIFYQRQLKTLRLHEIQYNQGHVLKQRNLDEMINQKIRAQKWRVIYTSRFGNSQQYDNEWLLIQTR